MQSTIIVTPVAGSSASPALKLRIVENSNISNDIINTATNASSTPATLPMTTAQPGSAISIYWAADDTSTLYYPKCVASSSASNNWNWVSGWTGATITPLVWGGPISDSPTVATTYTVFCPSQVSGPDLTASITVTPKGATNNTQSCTGASSGGALTGWAWSDNVGWIKMDGVVYDTAGNFSGYAWADTVGWIRFGGLSGWPSGGGTLSSNAVLNTTIGKIGGWAQVLSMAGTSPDSESFDWADGWISLYSNGTDVSTPYTYGPAFNLSTGNAITPSYAWGGNVTGWVDFSQVRLIPCTVKSAKLELMIKDNSNPTNTITATANQAPNGPNASGSATLVINSAHSFDISWAGDDRTTMFYPKCTASTSSPSTNSWTWTGWLSNTGATITPLSWGHHIQNTDQITSTQKYVITCPSLISTGTTLTAVIQVKPIICDVGSTDPACSNTSDVSSLNINAPQNACGGGHYKPLLISLTGHGVTTGAQCTASISPALSINNHPEWTGNLSYSSVPNSYMLAFPSNNTNNTIPYTLNLSCPTTAALPNPADTSISPNHPTVINLLSTQDCNPGITEFYPTYPCVNPPIGENVPTMQVNVSAHGMSSCVVTDTVNGHDYPVTFNQPGMGTATVDVFGNNPNYTLSCTGNDNGTYVNTDFTDANGVPLNDFTIETTDQCSGTNPIIPPKPRPVFIER
ncbi:MAG: hypothetical protein NTW62_01060 [Candidatus Nomurabacteria bacterium]|nr:hypothetical protein [Candidatus Nomurabacteria bacterium]